MLSQTAFSTLFEPRRFGMALVSMLRESTSRVIDSSRGHPEKLIRRVYVY